MNSNCTPNYVCCSSLCCYRELNNIPTTVNCSPALPTPTPAPTPACNCCCAYCRQPKKLKPLKMITKPKASSPPAAVASKSTSKPKTKTMRPAKKAIRNDKEKQSSIVSQDVAATKSDRPSNNQQSLHSSSTSLNSPESSDSKQKLDLNMAAAAKNLEENYNGGSARASHSSRSRGSNQATREPATALNKSVKAKSQPKELSGKNAKKLVCNCCRKTSSPNISSPNTSRHSFSGTGSHSQLSVIHEVDTDTENNQRQCSDEYAALGSFWDANVETETVQKRSSKNPSQDAADAQPDKIKIQKSLEDSCADFLNIVCDNIMESVQQSVDCKLKEFVVEATEKFTNLTQKLTDNETLMRNLFQEQAENVNEQNKSNFENLYVRLESLLGEQKQTKNIETRDKECQVEERELPRQKVNGNGNGNDNGNGKVKQKENGKKRQSELEKEKEKEKAKEQEPEPEPENGKESEVAKEIETRQQTEEKEKESMTEKDKLRYEAKEDPECLELLANINAYCEESFEKKCDLCNCCFKEGHDCHPCETNETDKETPRNSNNQPRQTGGYTDHIKINRYDKREEIKRRNFSAETSLIPHKSKENFSLPNTLTNLAVASCGKLNSSCNSFANTCDEDVNKMQTCSKRNIIDIDHKKIELKLINPHVYDNYDASGYATEPEDNSLAAINSSERKKLQKKSLAKKTKHLKLRHTAVVKHVKGRNVAPDMRNDDRKRSCSQTKQRLSQSSIKSCTTISSPTRLSRL